MVGTLLSVVNEGGLMRSGAWSAMPWFKVGLNFLIPFLVAAYAARPSPTGDPPSLRNS